MSYKYEEKMSPNFTPAAQVPAYYKRKRIVEFGAGHWWGDPNAGYSHDGVVNTFLNPKRQGAAHLVVSAGRVTKMVNFQDAAWCTSNANPFTIAIEVDPRLHLGGALADQIRQTLMEVIADLILPTYGNLEWKPHKTWVPTTACNPLDWVGIRNGAWQLYQAKQTPEWIKNLEDIPDVKLMVMPPQTPIYDLRNLSVIKQLGQGTWVDVAKQTRVGGKLYYLSNYSVANGMPNGLLASDMGTPTAPPVNEKPEWLKNWQDIADKDMYTRVDAELVNLENGNTIKTIPRNTKVRIASTTEWHGKKYALTEYSTNAKQPNGLNIDDLDDELQSDQPVPPLPEPTPQPSGIKYHRYTNPIIVVTTKQPTKLWDFNGKTWGEFKEKDTFDKGKEITIVGDALHPLGGVYLMTEYSFGQADTSGVPHKTWGVNASDLKEKEVIHPLPPVEPTPSQPDPTPPVTPQEPVEPPEPEPSTPSQPAPETPASGFAAFFRALVNAIKRVFGK